MENEKEVEPKVQGPLYSNEIRIGNLITSPELIENGSPYLPLPLSWY